MTSKQNEFKERIQNLADRGFGRIEEDKEYGYCSYAVDLIIPKEDKHYSVEMVTNISGDEETVDSYYLRDDSSWIKKENEDTYQTVKLNKRQWKKFDTELYRIVEAYYFNDKDDLDSWY